MGQSSQRMIHVLPNGSYKDGDSQVILPFRDIQLKVFVPVFSELLKQSRTYFLQA